MAAVTVATVVKKAVEVLASNKKGRKFLGYVIGISVFILCIPIIVVFCVFGWTGGTTAEQFDPQAALAGAVHGVLDDPAIQERFENIQTVFTGHGLPDGDIHKAQFMSIVRLSELEDQEDSYERLASCFLETTEERTVYMLIEEAFGIDISEEDEAHMDEIYGVTPARKTSGGGR